MDRRSASRASAVPAASGALRTEPPEIARLQPVDSARGRILYSFTGSACEGYTSEFRQVSEVEVGEGKVKLSDLRSSSWEDGDGKSYRFKINSRMNDADSSPVDGMAERTGDHITVKLKQPEAKTFTLDGAIVFPTEQIRRIIGAAKDGKSLLELTVYDGSDNGQKVYNTLTVIGQPIPGDEGRRSRPIPPPTNDADESADPLAGDRELLRPRCEDARRRADAGLCDVVRALSRTASRASSCSTTTISSSPARSASSTSRTPNLANDGVSRHSGMRKHDPDRASQVRNGEPVRCTHRLE